MHTLGSRRNRQLPIFPDIPFIILLLDFRRQETFIFAAKDDTLNYKQIFLDIVYP